MTDIPEDQKLTAEKSAEIRLESFHLLQKSYDDIRASIESLNTRAGVALALVGSAVTAADLEVWTFKRPPYFEPWPLWLISNCLNLFSLALFVVGTVHLVYSLVAKKRGLPISAKTLANQSEVLEIGGKDKDIFRNTDLFYGVQSKKLEVSIGELIAVVDKKAKYFNCGISLILVALFLVIFAKLII